MAYGLIKTITVDIEGVVITNLDGCTDSFYTTESTCEARGDCINDEGEILTRYTETDCDNVPGNWEVYTWYDDIQTVSFEHGTVGDWIFTNYKTSEYPYQELILITKVEVGLNEAGLVEQQLATNYTQTKGSINWVLIDTSLGSAVPNGTYLVRITYTADVAQHSYWRRTKKWTDIFSTEQDIKDKITENGVTFSSGDATTSSFTAASGFVSSSYHVFDVYVAGVGQFPIPTYSTIADTGVITLTNAIDAEGEVVSNANYTVTAGYTYEKDIVKAVSNSGQTIAGDWEFADWRNPNIGFLQFFLSITRVQVGTDSSNLVDQIVTTNYTVDSEGEITWVVLHDDQASALSNGNYYFRITYIADGVVTGYDMQSKEFVGVDDYSTTWTEVSEEEFKNGEMSDGFDPDLKTYGVVLAAKPWEIILTPAGTGQMVPPSRKPVKITEDLLKAILELKTEVDDLGGTITYDAAWDKLEDSIADAEDFRTNAVEQMEAPYQDEGGGSTE